MMMVFLFSLHTALLAAAARVQPLAQPVRSINIGASTLRVHVPTDDAIMEAVMAEAHQQALQAGEERYDEVMEDYVASHIGPAYWAQLWPSAIALGRELLDGDELPPSSRVLELGCGLGLASICAAKAGAHRVIATDLEASALDFALANAAANGINADADDADATFRVDQLDWTDPDDSPAASAQHDLILAADVIYDEDAPLVLAPLLRRVTAEGGRVLLTDNADRPYADARREALLDLLCNAEDEGGGFTLVQQHTTRVRLDSRQGTDFEIVHCELERVCGGEKSGRSESSS